MGKERQILEVDILFIGGGPANLAGALRLTQLITNHNDRVSAGNTSSPRPEPRIVVIEKGHDVGAHAISGAILDPIALEELLPDYRDHGFPFSLRVTQHSLRYLTTEGNIRLPNVLVPPSYRQDHCYLGSLQKLNLWLAERVEAAGVYLFHETCGVRILCDDARVCGVETGDKGLEVDGGRKANYQPGTNIHTKITVFGVPDFSEDQRSLRRILLRHRCL